MPDYFQSTNIPLRDLRFVSEGGHYRGSGHLIWDPAIGARVLANVERVGGSPLPRERKIGAFRASKNTELASVKAESTGYNWVLIPQAVHADDLEMSHHLEIDQRVANYVTCLRVDPVSSLSTSLSGRALYKVADKPLLPHRVAVKTTLNEKDYGESYSMDGIDVTDQNIEVRGVLKNEQFIELSWSLDPSKWSPGDSWKAATAFRWALVVLLGQNVALLSRKAYRSKRSYLAIYEERIRTRQVRAFKELTMLGDNGPNQELFETCFLPLVRLFMRHDDDIEASVAKHLVHQIVTASESPSDQIRELITGVGLEAALRTLDNLPHTGRQRNGRLRNWEIGTSLKRFRDRYWTKDWEQACQRAKGSKKQLRERHAHADWLSSSGGSQTRAAIIRAYNDRVFLSRFYGYMVLGLAGVKPLTPAFPRSVDEWTMITVRRKPSDENQEQ